jgi:hypothetical protein
MAAHRILFNYLWIAPHVLQVALAVIMLRRKLAREFPAFFAYTVYEVLQFLVLYTMAHVDAFSGEQYAAAWLVGGAFSIVLRFAIVSEIFHHVFQDYPSLNKFGMLVFRWATVVLMVVAVVLVASASGGEPDRNTAIMNIVDRTVSIVQCGLLVLVLMLSRFLSFTWRSYVFGIALGLGLFASAELGISALRAQFGTAVAMDFFNLLTLAVYHCCVLLWIAYLLLPQRVTARVSSVPANDLAHWNDALERLLDQ